MYDKIKDQWSCAWVYWKSDDGFHNRLNAVKLQVCLLCCLYSYDVHVLYYSKVSFRTGRVQSTSPLRLFFECYINNKLRNVIGRTCATSNSMRSHLLCLLYFAIRSCRGVNIDEQESDVSGSVVGGGIRWRNLSVSLFQQKKGIQYLVEPSSGFIQDGHVTAVIGPSGAGKSSFLAALSGTTPKGSSKTVSGSVWRESQLCTQNYERYPLSIT